MECWKIVSASKMHGSAPGIKAFLGKLSIIEVVDLKFTSGLVPKNPKALTALPKRANPTTDEHGCHGFTNSKMVLFEFLLIRAISVISVICGEVWVFRQSKAFFPAFQSFNTYGSSFPAILG
jgi:hypothetical protein